MVALSRNRTIINQNSLDQLIRANGISRCRIRSKFVDNADIYIEKGDNKESFLSDIHDKVLKMAERLPHHQIVLKIKKENNDVDIILNPVTGAA